MNNECSMFLLSEKCNFSRQITCKYTTHVCIQYTRHKSREWQNGSPFLPPYILNNGFTKQILCKQLLIRSNEMELILIIPIQSACKVTLFSNL